MVILVYEVLLRTLWQNQSRRDLLVVVPQSLPRQAFAGERRPLLSGPRMERAEFIPKTARRVSGERVQRPHSST